MVALARAEQVRDLELDLYWRRAAYFWAFSAAAFGGYFALATAEKPQPELLLYASCLGTVFSWVWYLANRGGKYWQDNWEQHIDLLEDAANRPIYKTNTVVSRRSFWNLIAGHPFSVSKLNHLLSLFVWIVWVLLLYRSAFLCDIESNTHPTNSSMIVVLALVFLVLLAVFGRRSQAKEPRRVDMEMREYETDGEAD